MNKTQSIAFTALLCAVHILIVFMVEYVPFFDLFLIFFLPIFSAFLTIKCKLKYSLILIFASMLIGCLINPINAFLSLLTPLVYGVSYGLMIKNNIKGTTIIYALSSLSILLLSFDIFIITKILNENFIEILCNFFHLDSFYQSKEVLFLFISFAFAQSFVTHFVLKFTLKKLKYNVEKNKFPPIFLIPLFLAAILCAIFIKQDIYKHLSYWLATIFSLPYVIYAFQKNKAIVPLLIITVIVFLSLTIPLLKVVKESYTYLLFLLILIPSVLYGIFRQFKENKIKEILTSY